MSNAALLLAAALVAAAVLLVRRRTATGLRQAAAWFLIFIAIIGAYSFRFEAETMLTRITGELMPAAAIEDRAGNVTVRRDDNGHFYVPGRINGREVRMMVDTGASRLVLSADDAIEAGIDIGSLSYSHAVNTANGGTMTAPVMLQRVAVGSIERTRVPAWVARDGDLDESLLGLSFLDRLGGIEIRRDSMTMHDR